MYNLYYSPQCNHCNRLFREFNTNGLNLINITGTQCPPHVTQVPTLEDVSKNQFYVGKDVFDMLKNNSFVEPFEFSSTNNMKTGFSFIDSENARYCEQVNYVPIEEI